jgi:hypothetical protein
MNGRKANKEDKRRRQWRKQNACLTFHQIENKKKSFLIHFFCSQKRVCEENWFSQKKSYFVKKEEEISVSIMIWKADRLRLLLVLQSAFFLHGKQKQKNDEK